MQKSHKIALPSTQREVPAVVQVYQTPTNQSRKSLPVNNLAVTAPGNPSRSNLEC
jgi:hypothetical protein